MKIEWEDDEFLEEINSSQETEEVCTSSSLVLDKGSILLSVENILFQDDFMWTVSIGNYMSFFIIESGDCNSLKEGKTKCIESLKKFSGKINRFIDDTKGSRRDI